jgi:hypothetical protein
MFIPDPRSEFFPSRIQSKKDFRIPDSVRIRIKDLSILTQIRFPDPDLDFLPIKDPGEKRASDPGSGSATMVFCSVSENDF